MKDMLYEVRCLKSNEDRILALAGQFKQLLKLSSKCEDPIFCKFTRAGKEKLIPSFEEHQNCVMFLTLHSSELFVLSRTRVKKN